MLNFILETTTKGVDNSIWMHINGYFTDAPLMNNSQKIYATLYPITDNDNNMTLNIPKKFFYTVNRTGLEKPILDFSAVFLNSTDYSLGSKYANAFSFCLFKL